MTVYVVSMGWDYEGESLPDGVFDTLEKAEAWVKAEVGDREWDAASIIRKENSNCIQYGYGGTHYSITRLELK